MLDKHKTINLRDAEKAQWRQADFAANLYRIAAEASPNDNIVISPWGVANLFALLLTGARKATAKEMASALELGENEQIETVAATFKEAHATLQQAVNPSVAVELSDSLWLKKDFKVYPAFLSLARTAFDADVRTVEMGETARQEINAFVSDKTHKLIPELLEPGCPSPDSNLVALDTIYLKAKWDEPFSNEDTNEDEIFHSPDGDCEVTAMHSIRYAEILDAPDCAVLRLPYFNHSVEMLVMLPSSNVSLSNLEAQISQSFLQCLAASPWHGEVSITLPKFNFNSTHNLKQLLPKMGMVTPFDEMSADFSGLAKPPQFISEALQKAKIVVDEDGTEAAAATFACISTGCPPSFDKPAPREFKCDRPFIFMVRERKTGLILFMGRVMNPTG